MSTKIVSEARNIHGIILVLAAIMPAMAIISLVPVMPLLGREFAGVSGSEALVPLSRSLYLRYVSLFFRRWLALRPYWPKNVVIFLVTWICRNWDDPILFDGFKTDYWRALWSWCF